MKRCKQCDFIYEDDQSLCDMDGGELVFDAGALALVESAAIRPATPPAKSRSGRYTILPLAGIFLGAVLFPASYVFTRRAALTESGRPSTEVAAVAAVPPPPDSAPPPVHTPSVAAPPPVTAPPAPPAPPPAAVVKTAGVISPVPRRTPKPPPPPALKPIERKPEPATPDHKPEAAARKKESRLTSVLKKTGRLLKKPFKF